MKEITWPTEPDRFFETDVKQRIVSGSPTDTFAASVSFTYTPDNSFVHTPNHSFTNFNIPNKFSFKSWNKVALWNLTNQLFKIGNRKMSVLRDFLPKANNLRSNSRFGFRKKITLVSSFPFPV